jgi:hypothetical protein
MKHEAKWGVEGEKGPAKIVANCSACGASLTYTGASLSPTQAVTVEHPFANLEYRIFGHPRLLLRGLRGAQTEISLAVAGYHLKRMLNILGGRKLHVALQAT